MNDNHVRRRLFPKVKVTILEPVKLEVAADLKGKKRRVAAGAALYQIMSTLIFRTTNTDATLIERVIQTAITMGGKTLAVEDPIAGKLSYSKLLTGLPFSVRASRPCFRMKLRWASCCPTPTARQPPCSASCQRARFRPC